MEKVLISACLLGLDCKYNGGANTLSDRVIDALKARYDLVPVCPESYGGLAAPRLPSERVGERVLAKDGGDVTAQYQKGARAALRRRPGSRWSGVPQASTGPRPRACASP